MEKTEITVTVVVLRGGVQKASTATLSLTDLDGAHQTLFETSMELASMAARAFCLPIPVVTPKEAKVK